VEEEKREMYLVYDHVLFNEF